MTDYEKELSQMNLRQLVTEAVDIGTQYGHAVWKDGTEKMEALTAAIRSRAITEAAVGTCEFTQTEDEDYALVDTFYAYDLAGNFTTFYGRFTIIPAD